MRKVALFAAVFVAAAFWVSSGQKASAETLPETKPAPKIVVIKEGDSLSKIAKRHDSTYQRLFYANKKIKDPDLIYPGHKLRVPTKDEALKQRPIPGEAVAAEAPVPVQAESYTQPAQPQATYKPAKPKVAPVYSYGTTVWDKLAACESGGNWAINTGNGYYGGLQFSLPTWKAVGGAGYPHQASKAEQIKRGKILQARSGWGQWPACTAKLGLR